ncbi:MAG TPA: phasin family protein [Casimicrobiaceae bacterium]|nr:phasin family protein [Casimicrobiaceae bacterium]
MRTYEYNVLNASRQVWLASLGAAIVTRDWAQSEASSVFRNLVKEGTLVESRTIRIVGDRIEGSFAMANSMWKRARNSMQSTIRQAADTAVSLVQSNLPKTILPANLAAAKAAPTKKAVRARKAKAVKRGARRTKARTAK